MVRLRLSPPPGLAFQAATPWPDLWPLEANQAGGRVIYCGESSFRDASDAASAAFKELVDVKPRILLGTKVGSSGGRCKQRTRIGAFKEIDFLVRSNRVIETPDVYAAQAMQEAAMKVPSLHLRLAYATRCWASAYPADGIPSNIESFFTDLLWFMDRTCGVAAAPRQKLSGAEALEAIKGDAIVSHP